MTISCRRHLLNPDVKLVLSQSIVAGILCIVQSRGRLSSSPTFLASFLVGYSTVTYTRELETCSGPNTESYNDRKGSL